MPDIVSQQISRFVEDGFIILRGIASQTQCEAILERSRVAIQDNTEPIEYEADLHYPGAPSSRFVHGGGTPRRLLDAFSRGHEFQAWCGEREVVDWLRSYFQRDVVCSMTHHNCVMTKHGSFGSSTGWHRDLRYWHFGRGDLVSSWLALGTENATNGGLSFIPGSHRMKLESDRFDSALFLRSETPENRSLIATAVSPCLAAGDVVLFHARTLHSAGRNQDARTKISLVFTYHADDDLPKPGTRSASRPGVRIPEDPLAARVHLAHN
ncbi:phytanoyl-CoA dioxygenase family protein [Paraburkholderia aromaticivorans]|uniref:Phytanoyl-CoA dioxygenase n=1 Tax=Paraburkholderia aromaticivorans TaxID=2026199 RepID=A0A248VQX2_9BURK|nr:phytanoyl-CoA dioxygenase family protein [Paraburkholderia aromaticivorans]ASW01391.1 hypothetical protein CJU94_24745 [Paraburkholderia aromaticivorans]